MPTLPALQHLWTVVWPYLCAAVTIASTINMLPQPKAGSHWTPVRQVISWFALAFGGATSGTRPPFSAWLIRVVQPMLAKDGLSITSEPDVKSPEPSSGIPLSEIAHRTVPLFLMGVVLAMVLSACSTTSAAITNATAQANGQIATASKWLPPACTVLALANANFQVASGLDPDIAKVQPVEVKVYQNLTTGSGICSPQTMANPPSNVGALIVQAYGQLRAFVPTLPPPVLK